MEADIQRIRHTAELAAIHLDDAEAEAFAKDLAAIISHMEQLMRIDTGDVKPMEHVLPVFNRFRADEAVNGDRREALLKVAPKQEDGCYLVPNVVE